MQKKIRIILGGLLRGSKKCHDQLAEMQKKLDAKIYVSSYESWGPLSFEYDFIETPKKQDSTCFEYNSHQHRSKYIEQWAHLSNCYNSFKHNFNENDIIIKYRNDLYINDDINYATELFENLPYSDKDFFTPAIEFHEKTPFNVKKVCNDQIYCVSKKVADTLFNLPYKLNLFYPHKHSIEECLNKYILQENMSINTFNLTYEKKTLDTNTCIFTTHTTLNKAHAECSLKALLELQTDDIIWDNFVIYNTHNHELSDNDLVSLVKKYDTKGYVKNTFVFPYDQKSNKKNLLQDIRNWYDIGLSLNLHTLPGKVFWLKSDYCVSNNFNKIFLDHSSCNFMWSLPIYNAKQKIAFDSILSKLNLEEFVPIDNETYYRGGDNPNNTLPNEELSPNGQMDYDSSISYVSHNYVYDFNLHVISNDTLPLGRMIAYHPQVFDMNSTWGGPHNLFFGLKQSEVHYSGEHRAYGVHMYHEIVSENRSKDRGDIRKLYAGERY